MFFYLRDLSLSLRQEAEQQLPLTKQEECVRLGDVLDLSEWSSIVVVVIVVVVVVVVVAEVVVVVSISGSSSSV